MIQVKIYPLPLTLFLILIWTFLILAPLNVFAADKTFTCKPVVAGSPKKDGNFYVEDITEKSTPTGVQDSVWCRICYGFAFGPPRP